MQIHDLNTKALTDPAYVAFDDGTDTYKTEFNDVVANAAAAAVADADLTDNTVAFTSGDAASPTAWTAVDVLTSGLSLKTLFNRISTMVKNVRYIWSKIGTASMGTTATTITGAIAEHETDISGLNSNSSLKNAEYSDTTLGTFGGNFKMIAPNENGRTSSLHKRSFFLWSSNTKSNFSNIPTKLNEVTDSAFGYREVFWRSSIHILVVVTEMYPVPGRKHYCVYNNGAWSSWHCQTPTT